MVDLTIKIGGEAGYGIMNAGLILSKTLTAAGYYIFGYPEYPSLIRGGHNTFSIRISEKPISCPKNEIDVLLALDNKTIEVDSPSLTERGFLIYDGEETPIINLPRPRKAISVPLTKLTKEIGGDLIIRNTVGLGALFAIFDLPITLLETQISDEFSDKDQKIVSRNLRGLLSGYRTTRQTVFKYTHLLPKLPPDKTGQEKKVVVTGNGALAAASIAAGMSFSAIYPMTPIQSLLTILKSVENKIDCQVIQPADEIEGISMAIGASFAGKKSMVATSGGGFCLMVESLGLAAQTETPLVIILGSRPGPATGLPTWTEQSDLRFALNAAHGDFPRLVFTPGNLEEIIVQTKSAFDLSQKYRLPAIILVDKFLCESFSTLTKDQLESFNSNTFTPLGSGLPDPKGVKPEDAGFYPIYGNENAPTGTDKFNYLTKTSSDEHTETGFLCEDPDNRTRMMRRRFKKLKDIKEEIAGFEEYGDKAADILAISWGSTKPIVREAVERLNQVKYKIKHLSIDCFSPFPSEKLSTVLKKFKKVVIIENNYSGQAASVIRENTGVEIQNKLLKYDGRPFSVEEVIEFINGHF